MGVVLLALASGCASGFHFRERACRTDGIRPFDAVRVGCLAELGADPRIAEWIGENGPPDYILAVEASIRLFYVERDLSVRFDRGGLWGVDVPLVEHRIRPRDHERFSNEDRWRLGARRLLRESRRRASVARSPGGVLRQRVGAVR